MLIPFPLLTLRWKGDKVRSGPEPGRDLHVLSPPCGIGSASHECCAPSLVEGWEVTQEWEAVRQNQAEGGHRSSENAPGLPASPPFTFPGSLFASRQHDATFEQKFLVPEGDLQN